MAQLDVERKSRNSMWWLWLLIALVIVFTIWWFVRGTDSDRVAAASIDGTVMVANVMDSSAMEAAAPAASTIGSEHAL